MDSKININGWSPKNYKDIYLGQVSIEEAFSKSINTYCPSRPTAEINLLKDGFGEENVASGEYQNFSP